MRQGAILGAALTSWLALAASAEGTHPFPLAPAEPERLGAAEKPRMVLLTASWCQWCKVLELKSLPAPEVQRVIHARYLPMVADVDRAPLWMDVPGVSGLPAFVVFDEDGRHVITRAGYRDPPELAFDLEAVADKMRTGDLSADAAAPKRSRLSARALTPPEAARLLAKIERALFFKVNDHDGGFLSPSRHPFPALLVELQRFSEIGAPRRVQRWIELTLEGALRGGSPRMRGQPLADMSFSSSELIALTYVEERPPPRWFEGVSKLAEMDPWLGLQDPVDGGVFRYAAGPGWYHPHFERRAFDNLAWAELLGRRRDPRARRIEAFVFGTFARPDGWLSTSQESTPFYFRLNAHERRKARPPRVDALVLLSVQARASRVRPSRCPALGRLTRERWGDDPFASSTATRRPTVDEVGEVLAALAHCPRAEEKELARRLADVVVQRWRDEGFATSPRLFRLADGVCAARPRDCPYALASVTALDVELAWPPPLAALARVARR